MSENESKVRVGIIGAGQIGKRHIERYLEIESTSVVAVTDVDEVELRRVCERFSIPHQYRDMREMLGRDDIDAVDICLHNNLHLPATRAAFEADKDVYCEKPMAGSYKDAEEMFRLAVDHGKKLSIQLSTLFEAETKAARLIIADGHLGKIYHARSTGFRRRGRPYVDGYGTPRFVQKRNASGGALYDMGVYNIARIIHLLGNPLVETVSGRTYQETPMDESREGLSGYDVEELALGFARLEGNLTLDIIEAWAVHMNAFEGASIFGSHGGIRLEPFGYYRCLGDLDLDSTVDLSGMEWRLRHVRDDGDAYDSPQHHWIAALQGRVELLPTAEVALTTMLISEGIYLSHELGREVTADEIRHKSRSNAISM